MEAKKSIEQLAIKKHWEKYAESEKNFILRFRKFGCRMWVNYKYASVVTVLKHPVYGKTRLVRYHVTMDLLEKIMENPRVHSGQGYISKFYEKQRSKKSLSTKR